MKAKKIPDKDRLKKLLNELSAKEIKLITLKELYEPQKDRLIANAKKAMDNAQDPWFKDYWTKVYVHLCKQWKKLQ